MNSYDKYQQQQDDENNHLIAKEKNRIVLSDKVQFQINSYKLQFVCAKHELEQLTTLPLDTSEDYYYKHGVIDRRERLRDEMAFCRRQITAYETNDNKNKIIPDRLL